MRASDIVRLLILPALTAALGAGCSRRHASSAERLSLLVAASERPAWQPIARRFEREHPGVRVEISEGPNSTDLRENLYTAALLARDDSFDLVYMDVTWTAKFAAAGWLRELDSEFGPARLSRLLSPDVKAGRFAGHLYRIPVRTDVGVLYWRRDLLRSAGLDPPRTLSEFARDARRLQSPPKRWGFVWQGAQYEGLVCDYLEVLDGCGGFWIETPSRRVGLDRPEAATALRFLLACVSGPGAISPPGVTAYREEEARRLFQSGRAVFSRNWPYAWRLAQGPDSAVAGRIGAGPMVSRDGRRPASTLGGWGLGISRFSRHPDLAAAFIRDVVSLAGQRDLCGTTGFAPALKDAYSDPVMLAGNPFLPIIAKISRDAVARPVIARYAAASDILQRHLSAALSGLEPPEEALHDAAEETRNLLGRSTVSAGGA